MKTAKEAEDFIEDNRSFGFGVGENFKKYFGDEFLIQVADVGLECLVELKSPGCQWLDLCEA